jgi:hypothetical protein
MRPALEPGWQLGHPRRHRLLAEHPGQRCLARARVHRAPVQAYESRSPGTQEVCELGSKWRDRTLGRQCVDEILELAGERASLDRGARHRGVGAGRGGRRIGRREHPQHLRISVPTRRGTQHHDSIGSGALALTLTQRQ